MLSEVSNLEEVRSLLRLGGWRKARRGGSEKIPERDGSSLRETKLCFKVLARLEIRGWYFSTMGIRVLGVLVL